jgi:hypothetical protein
VVYGRYTYRMKTFAYLLLSVAITLPFSVSAQWQWLDKDGRKVFSDRPPPDDVPAKNILTQPRAAAKVAVAAVAPASAASAPATPASAAASAPKASGKDKELEEKKKLADAAEAAKKKEEAAKIAKDRAENCQRAKQALTVYKSGERVRQPNAKGEMEFLTDEARAAETKRTQEVVNSNCS